MHANASAGFDEAIRFGAVTLYLGMDQDPSANVVLAHDDDPVVLGSALAGIRETVHGHGGRVAVRLIAELFPQLAAAVGPLGLRQTRREPMMTCSREQLQPVERPAGISFATLTGSSSLEAILLHLELNERGFDPTFAGTVTIEQAEGFRRTLIDARAFTARLYDEPAGAGMFHSPIDGLTQFSGIATLAPFRRKGIAAALTTFMAQAAFDAGADLVYLAAANEPARRVYHRLGFREVGTLLVFG